MFIFIVMFLLICIIVAFNVKEGYNNFKCRDFNHKGCNNHLNRCYWNSEKDLCKYKKKV